MTSVDQPLGRNSFGGRSANRAANGRRGAAAVLAVAALCVTAAGCAQVHPPPAAPAQMASARRDLSAGLALYESSDYALAAGRFHQAVRHARVAGDRNFEAKAVTAECIARLRARALAELADCTSQLEYLQRHSSRSDPGVNTLIAMGAIAGRRPLPPFRVPAAIQPLLQQAAQEAP